MNCERAGCPASVVSANPDHTHCCTVCARLDRHHRNALSALERWEHVALGKPVPSHPQQMLSNARAELSALERVLDAYTEYLTLRSSAGAQRRTR